MNNPHSTETGPQASVAEQPAALPVEEAPRNGNAAAKEEPPARSEGHERSRRQRKNGLRFDANGDAGKGQRILAVFCYEPPGSPIGQYIAQLSATLAGRGQTVALFTREAFTVPGVTCHAVGGAAKDIVDAVYEFGDRAAEAFRGAIPPGATVTLLGHEWSGLTPLVKLRMSDDLDSILLLHSLERQRSDLSSDMSRRIEELERAGLRDANAILVHNDAAAKAARDAVPECASRVGHLIHPFSTEPCAKPLDQGTIKAKYQVGPIDPMILFIGDMDARHGIDVLMKSVPCILKNHPQARFVFVGDGDLHWPMRVHARYLLLEHAVRFAGDVHGSDLHDLIQAADIIAVPSRVATEWWPVQMAWAAGRPVVVSRPLADAMGLQHEQDSVVIYPHESSCVWGIERILHDPGLIPTLAAKGKQQLETRFGWAGLAQQIETLMGVEQSAQTPANK
jgi:glycosyltransferase involved in cell wall biosynthesis